MIAIRILCGIAMCLFVGAVVYAGLTQPPRCECHHEFTSEKP